MIATGTGTNMILNTFWLDNPAMTEFAKSR